MNKFTQMFQKDVSTNYGAPFDDAGAGIILRSSDLVDFRVYKVILAKASPVFKGMFAQPEMREKCAEDTDVGKDQSAVVIPVSEDSSTLASVLMLCYPLHPPALASLEDMAAVIAATKKYGMGPAYEAASRMFAESPALRERPAKAYGIVCGRRLEREAQIAARFCLRRPLSLEVLDEDMPFIDGHALRALWVYHRRCAELGAAQAENFQWLSVQEGGRQRAWVAYESCSCSSNKVTAADGTFGARRWWVAYMAKAAATLRNVPYGENVTIPEFTRQSYHTQCKICRTVSIDELHGISLLLSRRVEEVIDGIQLELPF